MKHRKHTLLALSLASCISMGGCGKTTERIMPIEDSASSAEMTDTQPAVTTAATTQATTTISTTTQTTSAATTTLAETTAEQTTVAATVPVAVPATNPPQVIQPTHVGELQQGVLLRFMPSVEVYSDMTLMQLVTEYNVQVQNGDTRLDTETLGRHSVDITYLYNNQSFTTTVEYSVADTTKPILLNSGSNSSIKRGNAFNINNFVGVADNYDDHPSITYTGAVNVNVCGTYPLTVTASDASGNATSWNINVTVKEGSSSSSSGVGSSSRISFADFKAQYGTADTALGIDVSRWQDSIDFNAVKAAGCEFVIMRIASQRDNEISKDIRFDRFFADAKSAGLKVGVYIYSTAYNEQMLHEATAFINNTLNGATLDFPVVFDWEDFTNYQKYGISQHGLNRLFDLFVADMRGYGYDGMLYSSKNPLENFWINPQKYHPVWLAHYTQQTNYQGGYAIWQRCAVGRINGIAGDVDFDVFYKNRGLPF